MRLWFSYCHVSILRAECVGHVQTPDPPNDDWYGQATRSLSLRTRRFLPPEYCTAHSGLSPHWPDSRQEKLCSHFAVSFLISSDTVNLMLSPSIVVTFGPMKQLGNYDFPSSASCSVGVSSPVASSHFRAWSTPWKESLDTIVIWPLCCSASTEFPISNVKANVVAKKTPSNTVGFQTFHNLKA